MVPGEESMQIMLEYMGFGHESRQDNGIIVSMQGFIAIEIHTKKIKR